MNNSNQTNQSTIIPKNQAIAIIVGVIVIAFGIIGAGAWFVVTGTNSNNNTSYATTYDTLDDYVTSSSNATTNEDTITIPRPSVKSSSVSRVTFTNNYGTATTICAEPGCSNYIASSGDTHNCVVHANRCVECGIYIDSDAVWCMTCILEAFID
jgi:hypothetical protein